MSDSFAPGQGADPGPPQQGQPPQPGNPVPDTPVPGLPVLVAGLSEVLWLSGDVGDSSDAALERVAPADAAARARIRPPLLCHGKAIARRLAVDPFSSFDILELFAFVRPAGFCVPTPKGLATALGLSPPSDLESAARCLRQAAERLLAELAAGDAASNAAARTVAEAMTKGAWHWGPAVLSALARPGPAAAPRPRRADSHSGSAGLAVWEALPSWSDQAPAGAPGQSPVSAGESRARLAALLGGDAELRPQQADYASAVSQAFSPREAAGAPRLVLAEAGTGVGKTLGYIAPASLWAEKNRGPVWISTYTRNLQHQIDGELTRLHPVPKHRAERVVIRKGRENYLCLLNFEEAVNGLPARPGDTVAVGLMARWAARTRDGDMVGGDFPGWLADLLGRGRTLGLTDRRGECVYSACAHYGKCFIERGIRRARGADIVVANHALVMSQAALGGGEEGQLPGRYIFDEGHQVFAAADSAFAVHLTGREAHGLRRWLLGGEGGAGARRIRGLKRRLADLIAGDSKLESLLEQSLRAARALAGEGWHQRLAEARPQGPCEEFLARVRAQVYARVDNPNSLYTLEAQLRPATPELLDAARRLAAALARLDAPLAGLRKRLGARLDQDAEALDSEARRRIDATCRGLERRANLRIAAWRAMLAGLEAEPPEDTPPDFVDWLAVERGDGRDLDLGLYRHWIDPTRPFAETLLSQAHGVVITSATLTDGGGDTEAEWAAAERRTGACHLPNPAIRAQMTSPFDYPAQTRVLVVTDLGRDDMDQLATAYRSLFLAAAGGGLGLFTAISRLRAVHARIGGPLEQAGLSLYAQHVDGVDTATLVDIFRAEEDACLLGTDAVRDGVDVPGRALRLIAFDRVPWPRPDIAHRARRKAFGSGGYDDRLARLRLKQAYGRLIRRGSDRGVFVMLDSRLPSRLAGAFPEGVEIRRLGLAAALREVSEFL